MEAEFYEVDLKLKQDRIGKIFSPILSSSLEVIDNKYLMTEIDVFPTLTITYEEAKEKARKVLKKSKKACLISNSIKSKVNIFTRWYTVLNYIFYCRVIIFWCYSLNHNELVIIQSKSKVSKFEVVFYILIYLKRL